MTKEEQIASLVQMLAETFRVELTELSARAYVVTLEELNGAELREAGRASLRECERMPSPAQLLRLGLKARMSAQEGMVATTDRMLAAMKPSSYPTAEEMVSIREERRHIMRLAASKSFDSPPAVEPPPMTDAEQEAKKAEIREQMAARGVTLPEGSA